MKVLVVVVVLIVLLLVLISGNINTDNSNTSSHKHSSHNITNSQSNIHISNNTIILMTDVINDYHRRLNLGNGMGPVQFAKYSTGISGKLYYNL